MRLSELDVNKTAYLKKINLSYEINQRLIDLGLIKNTKIECIVKNKYIAAYLVRSTVIAIRNCEANNIIITSKEKP